MTDEVVSLESVPQAAPEQPEPDSVQVTPWSAESFCTEAVKFAVVETCTVAEVGLMETEMGGGAAVTVMAAEADSEGSETEVAVRVTEGGVGVASGAV